MKIEDVQKCSLPYWYNEFKRITLKSIILPVPEAFLQYILTDGIVLPESSKATYTVDSNSSDESDTETDWENDNSEEVQSPHFPDFDEKIQDAIDTLGGKVFPKLNWSSPRDAAWINFNNSCCCSSVPEIYLLFKSSDFIIHDLTKAFLHCEDYKRDEESINSLSQPSEDYRLVLRKWLEIDTSGEFRCFVRDNNLIGICQRETSLYFDHIGVHKNNIIEDITSFYEQNIQYKFPSSNYVFDVYRKKEEHVILLDFNPFGVVTESLLFSWDELTDESFTGGDNDLPDFRYVDENLGVQPQPLSFHAIPKDIVDICTGEDSFKLMDFIKLKVEQQLNESSSDDETEEDGHT